MINGVPVTNDNAQALLPPTACVFVAKLVASFQILSSCKEPNFIRALRPPEQMSSLKNLSPASLSSLAGSMSKFDAMQGECLMHFASMR
jgi:hypothetical protein